MNHCKKRLWTGYRIVAAVALFLMAAIPVMAQLDTGNIRGVVKDPTGAAIPGAAVQVVNAGTQRTWSVTSDRMGEYTVPTLPVGMYSVTASAKNFSMVRLTGIALNASESYRADLLLQPGTVTQQITVKADQMQVNTLTSDLGTTIEGDRVANLPLNGRDFADLLALVPGSVTSGQFGQTSLGGTETSYAGVNILLDGTDATRIDTNATSMQLGREGARLTRASVDSIAEFHVLQGNFSAEYGRSIGDVVNVITKSGTNIFHGEVFEFFRNDALDAKNYFATAGSKTPLRLNQFGGNLGGPFVREKLFFFSNYEGVRQTVTNSHIYDVLNTAHRALFVPAMAPVVAAIPVGNMGVDPNNSNFDLYSASLLNTLREDTGSVRMDWSPSEKNKFYARYNIGDSYTTTTYGPAAGQIAPTPARSQFLKLSSTHIFSPSLLNEAGFGINSNHVASYGGGGNFPVLALSCFYCDFGVAPGPATFSSIRPQTSYQYIDTLTKLWGRHSLKVGADIRHSLSDEMLELQEFLFYGSISDFENNNGFAFSTLGNPWTRVRGTNWDFFAQDDIRLLRNLTLNLGVRYEYNSVLHEKDNQIANFDIATQTMGKPGAQLYQPDRNNLAPRVGFSWDPFGRGLTVLRAGAGAFYNPQLTGAVFSLTDNTSQNISVNVFQALFGTVSCTPSFPLSYPVETVPSCTPQVRNVDQFDSKMRDSYAWHWSFGVQQQVAKDTVLDVSYSGHRGLKLPAGAAFAGLQYNNQNVYTGGYPLSTEYANERYLGNYLDSNYNSMQTSLRGHHVRLTYDVNYTWSHEFDDTVDIFSGFNNPTNPHNDYSQGATDVRNNMTADLYYRAPDIPHLPQLLGRGWEIGAIASARSGMPVNIVTNVSAANGGMQRPELKPNHKMGQIQTGNKHGVQFDSSVFKNPTGTQATSNDTIQGYESLGNIPRNTGRGPGFAQVDLSFKKVTQLAEKWRVEFRTDLFNIANHANFANPDGNLTDAAFGRSTSTINSLVGTGTSRQLQFSIRIAR